MEELDQTKRSPLLTLKYDNSINDAIGDLGDAFAGFQMYLYQRAI